jgi:hypothetical protein
VRAATVDRKTQWTVEELEASLPRLLVADAMAKSRQSDTAPPPQPNAARRLQLRQQRSRRPQSPGLEHGVPQQAGMWFQIELPASITLTEIQFASSAVAGGGTGAPSVSTAPRSYQVQISADGNTWSAPVAEGQATEAITIITFAPVRAKFVESHRPRPCPMRLRGRCGAASVCPKRFVRGRP